jgi:hypothetical protein
MITKTAILCAGASIALTLGACGQSGGPGGRLALTGSSFCAPFKTGTSATTDPAAAVDDCTHRWAYALASDGDSADVVAQAVMNACSAPLSSWSQQISGGQGQGGAPADQMGGEGAGGGGQTANPALAQKMGMAEGRALYYVVQARSAGCSPPPSNSLPGGGLGG